MKSLVSIAVLTALELSAISWAGEAFNAAEASAARCCAALETAFSNQTYSPADQPTLYQQSIASYFSVQDRIAPSCFVSPKSTQDVSKIVKLLSHHSCHFAIRSGGHGLLVGSSNIVVGVTIDLSGMNSVTLNTDNTTALVQPGAKWIHVYETLDPLGYAIPGGRAGDVGVGGLTSGGGNSFFAARYGFVCDNVKNFEVVLGNGEIVEANNKTNPDLFTALKGSQNNLAIITRLDIVAFKQPLLWGGTTLYDNTTIPKQIEAFVQFTDNVEKDPYGSLIFVWTYTTATKQLSVENLYEYTEPFANNATEYPPAFSGFAPTSAIGPPINNTLRTANLSSLTGELNSPANLSNLYATLTFSNNLTVMQHVVEILDDELNFYKKDPFFVYASVEFQPLPRIFTQLSLERGGNVLGLDRYEDNNIIFLLDMAWNGTEFDARIRTLADRVMTNLTTYLHSAGALKDFQYINYSFQDQDPLGGYGDVALDKIKAASKKYDPGQVFQRLVPGGFKLRNAGKGTSIGLP